MEKYYARQNWIIPDSDAPEAVVVFQNGPSVIAAIIRLAIVLETQIVLRCVCMLFITMN
jgi:hypothetical protein